MNSTDPTIMDQFTHRTLETKPFSLTYSYYLSPGFHDKLKSNPSTPTLLILHGYPDDAHMWTGAIPQLSKLGFPMVVPDLLGFGGTSKPTDASMYRYKQQSDSLAQILDHEGVAKEESVIPIGHDWGSGTAQRFYLYNKSRCIGLSLLSLAYQMPSSEPFDLDTANKETAKRFGYPQWEYWNFFTADDAPNLMLENVERFYDVNHGNFPSPGSSSSSSTKATDEEKGRDIWMREMFCVPGGMRDYVAGTGKYASSGSDGGKYKVDLKDYSRPHSEVQARFVERMKKDGFEGPVQYYHSLKHNHNLEDERSHLFPSLSQSNTSNSSFSAEQKEELDRQAQSIDVPMLYIGCTGDWVCRTDLMDDAVEAGLVDKKRLEVQVVDAGHWVLYEKPELIGELLADWLGRTFAQ